MRITISSLLMTAAICVVLGAGLVAQEPSFEFKFEQAAIAINEHAVDVANWERWAWVSLVIVIFIGVLGVATAGLQSASVKWKGIATAVAGALISGVTAVNSTIVPADFKTLDHLAAKGNRLVGSARLWVEKGRAATNDGDRMFALDEIEKRTRELATLKLPEAGAQSSANSERPSFYDRLVPTLHAAESSNCGCLKKLPKSAGGDLYSCGTGTGRTLKDAYEKASIEAADGLVAQLRNAPRQSERSALLDYVRRVAEEYDSCPGAGGVASISVILRVPKGLATPEALQAFLTRTSRNKR